MGTRAAKSQPSEEPSNVLEGERSGHLRDSERDTSATEVALTFLRAWTSRDFAAARALCHADLHFRGPMETRSSADEHLSSLAIVAGTVTGLTIVRTIAQGADVVVLYNLMATAPAESIAIAELNVVRGGKLTEIRAYFDTHLLRNDTCGRQPS